jgi:hypothetical protein
MTTEQTVSGVLEGTIEALTHFDLERLLSLEERMLMLVQSGSHIVPTPALIERQNRLRRTLDETQSNLRILTKLRSRKDCERWER